MLVLIETFTAYYKLIYSRSIKKLSLFEIKSNTQQNQPCKVYGSVCLGQGRGCLDTTKDPVDCPCVSLSSVYCTDLWATATLFSFHLCGFAFSSLFWKQHPAVYSLLCLMFFTEMDAFVCRYTVGIGSFCSIMVPSL